MESVQKRTFFLLPKIFYYECGKQFVTKYLYLSTKVARQRHRWMDSIRVDVREIGCDGMDWIVLAHDRDHWRALLNTVMNLRVP
jgi:hypothetical protein